MHIQHAPLPDVTPEQLQWWFLNIGGNSKNPSDGKVYPNYLLMCALSCTGITVIHKTYA